MRDKDDWSRDGRIKEMSRESYSTPPLIPNTEKLSSRFIEANFILCRVSILLIYVSIG